jgi:PAS domain S-box-containing protein
MPTDLPPELQQRAVSLAAASFRSTEEATGAVLALLRELLGMRSVFLSRTDLEARTLTVEASLNAPGDFAVPQGLRLPLELTPCDAVSLSGESRVVADMAADEGCAPMPSVRDLGARAYVGVPVWGTDGRVWGTLCGLDPAPQGVPEGKVAWMQVLARVIAFQLERDAQLTAAQQAHALLAEQEALLRSVLDSSAEGLWGVDERGVCTFANPACVRLLGYASADELVGRDMHALTHHTRADGSPYPGAECRILAASRRDRPVDADDELLWRKDGTPLPVRYRASRLVRGGVSVGAVVAFEDLTGERAAEAERRQFFAVARDLLFTAGMDGTLRRVNPAFTRVLGWESEQLLGRRVEDFVHPDDRLRTHEELGALAQGTLTGLFEVRFGCRDGSWRWLEVSGFPLPQLGLVYGTARDITEEKQHQEFEQHLLGIVSHDLRNPLQAILLASHALRLGGSEPERVRAIAERIRVSADRGAALVRDLLDMTRVRLGRGIPLAPRPADLHALARAVADEVQAAWPGRQVRLEARGDGRGTWDPDRLAQVVQNLVTNALKYGEEGAPVTLETEGEAPGEVRVRVHNRGAPIPPERLPGLFEPLQRGSEEADFQTRSVGLGLYIVKHVAEAHGGSVDVTSEPASGTAFTVRLPRHAAESSGG